MEFFTADIHFSDEETLVSENRPFKSVKAYDRAIIKDWNKTAKKGDVIYVVGDMLDCNSENSLTWKTGLDLIKKVKADVVLIMGNNEWRIVKYFFNKSFDDFAKFCKDKGVKEVYKNLNLNIWGRKFNLTHQVKDANPRRFNLFGHTHLCSGIYHPYGFCVSTDLNHFRLFTKEILEGYMARKVQFWEPDDNINFINPFIKVKNGKVVNIKQKGNSSWVNYIDSNSFD